MNHEWKFLHENMVYAENDETLEHAKKKKYVSQIWTISMCTFNFLY